MWEFCEDIWMYFIGNELFLLFGMNMRFVPSDSSLESGLSIFCDFVSVSKSFIIRHFSEFSLVSVCLFLGYICT